MPFDSNTCSTSVHAGLGIIGGFGSQAVQLAPSDQGIGDIWPDAHPVAEVYRLNSGPFLRGEARCVTLNWFQIIGDDFDLN